MNDAHAHAHTESDPFVSIQSTEESAEKSIEKAMQKDAEAFAQARSEREEALKAYEDELKTEGMQKLKAVKDGATEKQNADLASARASAGSLKENAKNEIPDAINLITDQFKHSIAA